MRGYGHGLAQVVIVDLGGVELEVVFEDDIEGGTAGEFGFGTAGEERGGQAADGSDTGADTRAFGTVSDGADACAGDRGGGYSAYVFAFAARAGDFPFGVHGFLAAAIGAARGGVHVDGVTVGKDQSVEADAEFTAALDAAGALGIQEFAAEVGTDGDDDLIVESDGEGSAEIDGIAGLGAAGGDAIFEDDCDAG